MIDTMGLRGAYVLGCLLCGACLPETPASFVCQSDLMCTRNWKPGHCEATGDCTFDDPNCPSGRRYGVFAAAPLAGVCHDDSVSVNLVANSDLESGVTGWTGIDAAVTPTSVAHTGRGAARVCGIAGDTRYGIDDDPATVVTAKRGAVLHAVAWLRAGSSGRLSATIAIRETTNHAAESRSPAFEVGNEWTRLEIDHVLVDDALDTDLKIRAIEGDPCVLVDDLAVFRDETSIVTVP